MNNYKFKIRDRAEYTRIIEVLQAFYPDVKATKGLRYNPISTKYLYVTNGVISTGFNTYAFNESNNTLIELDSLFTMPANLNTEEVYPKLDQKEFIAKVDPRDKIDWGRLEWINGTRVESEEGIKEDLAPPTPLNDLMIDIETLGTKPGYAILSIGAVFFDLETGAKGDAFYEIISLESSVEKGFRIAPKTLLWWSKQDEGAYLEALGAAEGGPNTLTVENVVYQFKSWIENYSNDKKDLQVWGNSARFDLGMLETYFESVGSDLPWLHYNERDVRTLVMFAPHIKDEFVLNSEGKNITSHKPIADCANQIDYCSKIFNKIEVHE